MVMPEGLGSRSPRQADQRLSASAPQGALPRPCYLTDEWLQGHGVRDISELLEALRPESVVMRPEALRAIKATRLSFARNLIARMARERWRTDLRHMEMDRNGVGRFIYGIDASGYQLQFGMLALAPQEFEWPGRIADAGFDFLGAILDGPVDAPRMWRELDELHRKMWSGRTDNQCYGWTAINRSNRFFDHTVERLAEGKQPDLDFLATGGGYIVRNAGWHGNGRLGRDLGSPSARTIHSPIPTTWTCSHFISSVSPASMSPRRLPASATHRVRQPCPLKSSARWGSVIRRAWAWWRRWFGGLRG
jgi:hypothetical protein